MKKPLKFARQATESANPLAANSSSYRPQIIEGGHRRNRGQQQLRAGWPWVSPRWRLWQVDDGLLCWHHGEDRITCTPGMWIIHPADRIHSFMLASPGSHWAQLRFALCPDSPSGDPSAEAAWGVTMPLVLTAEQAAPFCPALADILSWWWRDDWFRLRADTRLASLLIDLAASQRQDTTASPRLRDDPFIAADELWHTRPLAAIAEAAQACGMSERSFRRHFQQHRGCTPSAFARVIMADLACDLLRDRPDWSISLIARHLGYGHVSTFVRAFQAEVGNSPQQWRQSHCR